MFHAKLTRPFKILSDDEVQKIHSATLWILESIGVRFEDEDALRVLKDAGATVDPKTQLTKLPASIVEEAIKKSPKTVRLCGRSKDHDLTLGDGEVYFMVGGNALHIYDLETGIRRTPTSEDCAQLNRVFDALEYADAMMPAANPQDVPQTIVDRVKCKIAYENCEKHYMTEAFDRDSARDLIEIAAAVSGGSDELRRRPILSITPSVISPLTWGTDSTQPLFECVSHGVPVILDCMPSTGLTSPITLAGSLVQQNAENLSFVTLAQLISPGTSTIPYSSPGIANMKKGNVVYGAVEVAIQCAAMSQIYLHYGIPYTATVGLTDSKTHDEQAAYERAVSVMLTALAGPSMFLCSGALNSLTETSFEQTVIDDEILGMVSRALSGMRVDDETMALDTIAKIGPTGHFLGQKHTRDFLMEEHYLPKLAHRDSRAEWEERGSKDIIKRARERAMEILRTHQPNPLEDHVRKKVEAIVEGAKRRHQKAQAADS